MHPVFLSLYSREVSKVDSNDGCSMVHDFNVAARAVRSECDASAGRFTRDSRSDEVGMGAFCPDANRCGSFGHHCLFGWGK
jgi:hypothetical protein